MKKLLVVLDEETAKVLRDKINKSEYTRQAIKYMSMDISTDTVEGMRKSYMTLARQAAVLEGIIRDIDAKVDYIAGRVNHS